MTHDWSLNRINHRAPSCGPVFHEAPRGVSEEPAITRRPYDAQPTINAAVAAYLSTRRRDDPASGCPLAAIGSGLSRTDKKARQASTEGSKRLIAVLAGKSKTQDTRRRARGGRDDDRRGDDGAGRANPRLLAEILRAAEESLAADQM
jgi:TetR/AcrR family transcriptional repressor of nem operon